MLSINLTNAIGHLNVRFWHKAVPHNISQATPAYQPQPFENPDTSLNC